MARSHGRRNHIFAAVLILGLVSVGIALESGTARTKPEHRNPGAPMVPTANKDWYEMIANDPEARVTWDEVKNETRLGALVRHGAAGEMSPNWITPVAQSLQDGSTVMGYTLRYSDRIALLITPTDRVIDVDAALSERTIDADVNGNERLWRVVGVRDKRGLGREKTTQKWESGDKIELPSVLEWQSSSSGPSPLITYALVGDVPINQLQAIAAKMQPMK